MTRYALVIGIGENAPPLVSIPQAVADAEAMAELLETHGGFRVTLLRGRVNRAALAQAFKQFWQQAANSEALIFYSGHGLPLVDDFDQTEVVLAPSDCELMETTPPGIEPGRIVSQRNGLSLSSLNQKLAEAKFSNLVMLLDCCHSGFLLEEGPLKQMFGSFQGRDYVLLTACRSFEQAWAMNDSANSVFTEAVLAGLAEEQADEQRIVTAERLIAFVKEQLRQGRQEPVSLGIGREVPIVQYRQSNPVFIDEDLKPYQGLNTFTQETARFFFGRDDVVQELLRRLERFNFVPLIGSSGSGKSSVIRAKVVPRLREMDWLVLEPFTPSVKPVANLIEALSASVSRTKDKQKIANLLEAGDLLTALALLPGRNRVLLVVDQFEEIFTVCPKKDSQKKFIDLLLQAHQAQLESRVCRLSILTTMRVDFLDNWMSHGSLISTIQRDQSVWLEPLRGSNLQDAIIKPLEVLNHGLEPVLLEQILNDVREEENCLPLLEFTLTELWESRDQQEHQLTSHRYLSMGRLNGALDRYAEKFYSYQDWIEENPIQPRNSVEKEWMKVLFLKLVRTNKESKDTRQRQLYQSLINFSPDTNIQEIIKALIDELIQDGRLLVAQKHGWISLSHEVLLEAWSRLFSWRQDERELRIFMDRLEDSLKEWSDKKNEEGYLLAGGLLKEAQELWPNIEERASESLRNFYYLSLNYENSRLKSLEEATKKRFLGTEKLLQNLSQLIQQFSPLHLVFEAAIEGLYSLSKVDRVLLYQIQNWEQVNLVVQACAPNWHLDAQDDRSVTWVMNSLQDWHEGSYYPVTDVDEDDLTATEQRILRQLKVQAQLVMPIFLEQDLWGLMAVQQCTSPRHWQPDDIDLLKKVVTQMTVALQQSELRAQVEHLNVDLDTQVQERTTQLQKALDWEAMLKRITDKVRDSLDENQILQKAVQELALVMGMGACNAALYDLERQTSTIYYEYVTTLPTSQGQVAKMKDYPEIYNQLLQAQHFQFCSITPSPVRGRVAMLVCPIFDNEGVLGDLWLVNSEGYAFSDREIRLVQQAANQCAIGLRQARLYQAAQARIAELEKGV